MHLRRWLRRALVGALATVPLGLTGCTDEVEDINRVQPHYQSKASLDGEWYFRQTLVDFPAERAYGFSGIECGLEKVRFDLRENELIAYRVHEVIPGLEATSHLEGAEYKGDPVARWDVVSHFDIIRDFNRATGEQSNVIVEDTTLRPWWERDYVRVAWASETMLSGPVDCSGIVKVVGFRRSNDNRKLPIDYERETDKFNPDHMQISDDHMMITNVVSTTDGGLGCWLAYGYTQSIYGSPCGSTDVKIRQSFKRIDPEEVAQFIPNQHIDSEILREGAETFTDTDNDGRYDDGEPFEDANGNGRWDDLRPVKYATVGVGPNRETMVDVACTPEVLDALEGELTLEDCRDLLWRDNGRFGFFRTEKTAYDRRAGAGHDHNRIHLAQHHQMWQRTKDEDGNIIPPAERDLRPIVYHLNPNYPEDLLEVTAEIGAEWNRVFMDAAMAATGRSADEIASQLKADHADTDALFLEGQDAGALFQIRENNCSVRGIEAFLDRHPELDAVVKEATAGNDLKPGNIQRACSALTWESNARKLEDGFVWQQMGDLRFSYVWWVNEDQVSGPLGYGPSSPDQETGQLISGNAYVYGAAVDRYARRSADIVRYINGELCDADDMEDLCLLEGRSFAQWLTDSGAQAAINPAEINPEFQKRISERLGTPSMEGYRPFKTEQGIDKAAMHRQMHERMRRPHPSDPMKWAMDAPANLGQARIEALKDNPGFRARMLTEPVVQLARRTYNLAPNEPLTAEAEAYALELAVNPGAASEEQRARSRFAAERNIFLGEGLDDSVIGQAIGMKGMDPEEVYQQLRREIFKGVMLHEIGHTVGLRHNFKASYDALNYQDDFWQIRERYDADEWDNQRLPEYRYASIMDYGARFNSDTKGLGKYDGAAIKYVYGGHAEVFDDDVPVPGRFDIELEFSDYSKIPEMLGGGANLTARVDRPVAELRAEKLEGVLDNADLIVQNRDQSAANFWSERTVPYFYCSDYQRGDLKCRTWDEGANHTEVVQSAIQRYWNYFFFTNYRRGQDENAFLGSFNSRNSRISEYITFPWMHYRFYDAYPVDTREDLLRAAMMGLNFVVEAIGTPIPGQYCLAESVNTYLPYYYFSYPDQRACAAYNVPLGQGRDLWLDFNDDYNYKIDYLGAYYDKIGLIWEIIQTNTRFFRITDQTDNRAFTIGYYSAFQNEMVDLLSDMMVSSLFFFRSTNMFQRLITNDGMRSQLFVDPRRIGLDRNTFDGVPRLYAQMPYNIAWQAIALSTLFNTNSHDRQLDFVEYISISEQGSGDDREIAEGVQVARFVHPHTGQRFMATRASDGRSLSYDLVALAQNYANTTWTEARDALAAVTPDTSREERDQLEENFERTEERLQEMVEFMESLRELKSWVDVGR